MHGLMSYRHFGRARDRAEHAFGRCVTILLELLSNDSRFFRKDGEVRDVWPRGHCHPFCILDWPVLVPAPVSIPGVPSWSLRGFLVSLCSVWSDRLRILLLLLFGTAGDRSPSGSRPLLKAEIAALCEYYGTMDKPVNRMYLRMLVGTGCKALCLDAAGRVSGRTGRGRGVNFVTLAGSPLTRHVALPDNGVGLDGQSCCCLIVGWPAGSGVLQPGLLKAEVTFPSLSITFRSFLPSAPKVRTETGLSPNSSSIGGSRYPLIGPPSVIGAEEVAVWRKKYELPDDVVIRVPDPEDRVSDFGVDEVPVYEGYFAYGFRGQITSLVAKISKTLGIYPGQLNPPAWRILIALQNLGDLYGLVIGVAEVLCSYSVSPLSNAEWRYYLHPRGKEPPVREIPKKERKRLLAFEGNWTEKFAFMHLPGFSSIWQLEGRLVVGIKKDTIEQVLKPPLERRQIPFLVSKPALKRCSIWGEMSGSKGDEALA
ncbi:hypothetical protein DY000_02040760 [Brassica cretica]|uniref:Uncharacterized protein n=1 Tax=Brassica cretica TaxID=69181 RepID=A0ABQ7B9A4_BRACR|nr:hypothetical protein DY000_02040760 [Brassica cretica]